MFNLSKLRESQAFERSLSALHILDPDDLVYAVDMFLRYPRYCKHIGPDPFFLCHPIRTGPRFPTRRQSRKKRVLIPVSFGPLLAAIAQSRRSQNLFVELVDAARKLKKRWGCRFSS